MNTELFNENLEDLISKMLVNIYYYDSDPEVEIGFTINCLETLIGRSFSAEEIDTWYAALAIIVEKALN